MSKLIKNWEELSQVPPNDKYKIIVDTDMCSGEIQTLRGDFKEYLSTHTFYGSTYKYSTELLKKYGFDIEIDNWDKGMEIEVKKIESIDVEYYKTNDERYNELLEEIASFQEWCINKINSLENKQ